MSSGLFTGSEMCQCTMPARHRDMSWSPPSQTVPMNIQITTGPMAELTGDGFSEDVVDRLWVQFAVQPLNRVPLFETPWTVAHQASLSFCISWSLLKLMPIELVMPSNHLILCRILLLLPSIFPSIRVFSNESALRIRWPKYWYKTASNPRFPQPSTQEASLPSGVVCWSSGHDREHDNPSI